MNAPRKAFRPKALAAAALAAFLLAAFAAGPALASDFYKPTPVPSSRDTAQPMRSAKERTKGATNASVLNSKIVKTTKNPDGTPKVATDGKKPGAL